LKYSPGLFDYIALPLGVLLLAAIFWASMTAIRRLRNPRILQFAKWALLLGLVVPLNGILLQLDSRFGFNPIRKAGPRGKMALFLLLILAIVLMVRHHQLVFRAAAVALVITLPFVLLLFAQALWPVFNPRPLVPDASLSPQPGTRQWVGGRQKRPVVVWIVFDELDQRLGFSNRPTSVHLPEFDRLRAQALFATNAFAPGAATMVSMPALIVGKLLSKSSIAGVSELMLTVEDNRQTVGWSREVNIFTRARELGVSSGLVGWYHPYCRVIGSSLDYCHWEPSSSVENDQHPTLFKSFQKWSRRVAATIPGLRVVLNTVHITEYWVALEKGKELLESQAYGLLLLHFPVPHPQGMYNRHTDDFSFTKNHGYLDNLELADRTLGELRHVMETAGAWQDATVIVSSDHWWRYQIWGKQQLLTAEEKKWIPTDADYRIPFLLKLRGQTETLTYEPEFNTVLTHDLILAILKGEVRDTRGAAAWLDARRTIGPSPYYPPWTREQL
jgi:hypothetical protein